MSRAGAREQRSWLPEPVPGAEFLPQDQLRRIQQQRLGPQLAYVASASGLFRDLWAGRPLPRRLESLAELPLSDKELLRQDQSRHPPFGRYLAADPVHVCRVHRTGGTSGIAMNLALSRADAAMTEQVGARPGRAAGLGPGHRVIHCLNYQLWMGGYTDHSILECTGATVVPFGVGSTARLVETIRDLDITAISCTPSYPAVIEQVIDETFDFRPRDLGLELALFGGEAGLDSAAFRSRLEETWGFAARNANYGVSDVLCNFAGQCERDNDLHFFALDVLYPELIDTETGDPRPWEEGATGELVLTHLAKECQPVVRFRTGDVVVLTATEPCDCGRTTPRFRVIGRADDMVVVRGINVFPTMIAAVVNEFESLSGEYRIELAGPGPYDALPLVVELVDAADTRGDLGSAVALAVKRRLGVSARVDVVGARTLPRTDGKTRRVVRAHGSV